MRRYLMFSTLAVLNYAKLNRTGLIYHCNGDRKVCVITWLLTEYCALLALGMGFIHKLKLP